MSREFVIGLDVGTTSVKACVFNLHGKLIADVEKGITSIYPQQGWVEQNPDEIEQSAILAVREAIEKAAIEKNELISLGFSAAMHSLICINEEGRPISPALIWADGRSYKQADEVINTIGNKVYAKTGTPIHPMTPFIKLLWMKENDYTPYKNAKYFMSIKEYLLLCWFGERVIDYSMASATGLFNPSTHQWEPELLELTGVTENQLSEIVPPTKIVKGINRDKAEAMGISADMPIVIGAADGQLANLGNGAILPGEVAVSVGTSGAIRQVTKGVKISESRETFCYSFTEDSSIIGGPTNNGGIAIQWLKDLLNDQRSFTEFLSDAEQIAPGADGMLFLPYLNGERAPIWNQLAKGNFYGVSITHKKEHFIRAVLEGITFNLYQIGKALERLAGEPKKVYVNGGLARSPLWLQMMADVFDAEIYVSESHHSAAWGAAWTSLVAIHKVDSFEEIKKNIPMGKATIPNKENSEQYKKIYENYEILANDMVKYFK
ncbi:carbohydrate kinase FGGY [Neobacillus bataviensis LMG 21833]|uniref:Carbohydrate kinase FGGY n=1 Tax=Neobacillus bataviensis LMG 21833 TaxID=1117379 RepID=K6D2R8_9BACI|nr:gluconokinase [Neobacillus bataviensis]EKN62504.1 carbohydrate kinase FGGY [Neobacillus bataviensis LMG 21833]